MLAPSGDDEDKLDPGERTGNWGAACWVAGACC